MPNPYHRYTERAAVSASSKAGAAPQSTAWKSTTADSHHPREDRRSILVQLAGVARRDGRHDRSRLPAGEQELQPVLRGQRALPSPASANRPSAVRVTRPSSSNEVQRPVALPRYRSARPRPAAALVTGESLARNTSSSRPRTWRSVPGVGLDAPRRLLRRRDSRHAARRTCRADTTRIAASGRCTPSRPVPSTPPKMSVPVRHSGRSAETSAWSRVADGAPASARPCTARATTRRTLVSTTGTALR